VLEADVCEIYTDVDGIYTTDPRLIKTARKINRIAYDEMLELTSLGGGKMHSRSIEFAKKYRVPLLVPAVAARIAMVQELTIPLLLFLGLATRIATIPLLGTIAVIQTFVYPNAYNDHLVWGSILALVLTRGPGVFSLDYVILRTVRCNS